VEYRNRKQASVYLKAKGYPISINRLAQFATTGEGPPFRYWGRYTLYTEEDLDAWAESLLRTPGPNVGPASLLAPVDRNQRLPLDKPLSPPTRQGRKYRPRRPRTLPGGAVQPELST
jgi:hypothetical protein